MIKLTDRQCPIEEHIILKKEKIMKKTVILLGCTLLSTIALGITNEEATQKAETILQTSTTVADVVTSLNKLPAEDVPLVLPTIVQSPKFVQPDKNQIVLQLLSNPRYTESTQMDIANYIDIKDIEANKDLEAMRNILDALPALVLSMVLSSIAERNWNWAFPLLDEYLFKITDRYLGFTLWRIASNITNKDLRPILEKHIDRLQEASGWIGAVLVQILVNRVSDYYHFVKEKLPQVTVFEPEGLKAEGLTYEVGISGIVMFIALEKISEFYDYLKYLLRHADQYATPEINKDMIIGLVSSSILRHNIGELYGFTRPFLYRLEVYPGGIVNTITAQKISKFYDFVKHVLRHADQYAKSTNQYVGIIPGFREKITKDEIIKDVLSWIFIYNIEELYGFIKKNFSDFLTPEQKEKIENALAATND